ncbi:GNAT family N-acetyltransferase [Streptomyces sp. NPDC053813]|uniref:GNAT family N-acetyltransferase n=1 Tax=Streptomyces sp. NPDC053813 TaxID=3365717 RepID=UPI0037D4E7E8
MGLLIRPATSSDADALMSLRIEAEKWLAAAGIDQWRSPGFRERALAKWQVDIEEGRTWVVPGSDDMLLGTVTLARPDCDFWSEADAPSSAVYVAKLITSRAAAGHRLGGRLLDWAGGVAQARGLPWVRLDVWRTNKRLQQYYLNEGFTHVRTEAPSHRLSGWMAQRLASTVMHPHDPLRACSLADTPESSG